jgi:hypothetical protein
MTNAISASVLHGRALTARSLRYLCWRYGGDLWVRWCVGASISVLGVEEGEECARNGLASPGVSLSPVSLIFVKATTLRMFEARAYSAFDAVGSPAYPRAYVVVLMTTH